MRKFSLLMTIVLASIAAIAQDPSLAKKLPDDSTHKQGWRRGAFFSLGIGQGSSSNWAAGAQTFSLSIASAANMFSNYKKGKFNWKNSLDLAYAFVHTTDDGTRKTDDKIDLYSKATHDISSRWSLGVVGNFRTQFTAGFDYDYLEKELHRRTSDFMAPGILVLAPGFDWRPSEYFSIFLSPVSLRLIMVTNDPKSYYFPNGAIPDSLGADDEFETPLSVLYGVDPADKLRTEMGGYASINFSKDIAKNIALKSKLDLFSNYLNEYRFDVTGPDQLVVTKDSPSPEKVDIFWTNTLMMKVNEYLNVSFGWDVIYDDDVRQFGADDKSAATQFKSQLTVGFSRKF